MGLQQTALFREGLLAYKGSKLLKGKHAFVQPFDGNLLEDPLLVANDKDLLVLSFIRIKTPFLRKCATSPSAFSGWAFSHNVA